MVSMRVVIVNRFPEIAGRLPEALAALVNAAAEEIALLAKVLAPFRTGALRDSIAVELTGALTATVGTPITYAIYQEFGTRFMAAHPYLVPATDQVRGILDSLFASAGGLGL